jgi:uncharacterized protein (DUF1501 family)
MLLFGSQRTRHGGTMSRREILQIGASTVLGLSLADRLRCRAVAGAPTGGQAKAVILLWLWGGPAHLDTFDPKPNAPLEFRGPFSPIPTRTVGIRISELFPLLAEQSHRYTLIRSMHTLSNDHGVAGTIGLTGSNSGAVDLGGKTAAGSARPATGAVVAKARGGSSGGPPFLVVGGKLHQGKKLITGEGGGSLGALYDPFRLEYDLASGSTRIPGLQLAPGLTPERLANRQSLAQELDRVERAANLAASARAVEAYRRQAFAMLTSPSARAMYDLSDEPAALADRYGRTRFGQSCLLARRLVERGVPFVQVNWSDHVEAEEDSGDGGWDHHYRNFQIMQDRHAPWLDLAASALLTDLADRGLLETTMVLMFGEFGRAPKINDKAGRDHWEKCYSALIAGGGAAGGRLIGASDARGEHPHAQPVTPADVCATVYHAAGITLEQLATMGLTPSGKVIEELF